MTFPSFYADLRIAALRRRVAGIESVETGDAELSADATGF
jgi:hypothetical protein